LFHLDENIDQAIARALRERGIDVTTSAEAQLVGARDIEQQEFSRESGRVILTQDSDFLRLHQAGYSHAGIIFASSGSRGIDTWNTVFCIDDLLGYRLLRIP